MNTIHGCGIMILINECFLTSNCHLSSSHHHHYYYHHLCIINNYSSSCPIVSIYGCEVMMLLRLYPFYHPDLYLSKFSHLSFIFYPHLHIMFTFVCKIKSLSLMMQSMCGILFNSKLSLHVDD